MTPETVSPDRAPAADQPAWRQDFPVDSEYERHVSRRDFVRFLAATSSAVACGHCLFASQVERAVPKPPGERAIVALADLAVGATRAFHYPDEHAPCLLLRLGPAVSDLRAYSQKCTHLACPVIPQPELDRLYCPCHAGVFALRTGRAVSGPPRRALPRIVLAVREGVVWAVGIDEGDV